MTRISRTGFVVRWLTGLTAIAGLAVMALVSSEETTAAAKPAPPPPPPPGIIYLKYQPSYLNSMKGDGSSNSDDLPAAALNALTPGYGPYAVPVNHVYGGSRWWISTAITGHYDSIIGATGNTLTNYPHWDIVAVRKRPGSSTQIDVIQLTDFFGILNILPVSAYPSNDSNDNLATSYVAAGIQDLRDTFVRGPDGKTSYDSRAVQYGYVRLPLTVSEFLAGNFEPFDDSLTDEEIDDLLWPTVAVGSSNVFGAASPDGSLTAAVFGKRLTIVNSAAPDYDNPVRLLWDGNVNSPAAPLAPQWSPDGTQIAFMADSSTNVWTISATGGAPKKVLAGTATSKFSKPIWSADSQYVVAVRNDYSGANITSTRLMRVPAGGGTVVDLGVIGTGAGPALRWVPSN